MGVHTDQIAVACYSRWCDITLRTDFYPKNIEVERLAARFGDALVEEKLARSRRRRRQRNRSHRHCAPPVPAPAAGRGVCTNNVSLYEIDCDHPASDLLHTMPKDPTRHTPHHSVAKCMLPDELLMQKFIFAQQMLAFTKAALLVVRLPSY